MRVPSNRMHRFPVKNNDTGYPLIAFGLAVAFVVWFGYTLWSDPGLILFLTSTFGLLFIIGTFLVRRRDRRIASLRPNESMCTFARSFDCRTTDTWIIRAVYEKFQPFVGFPLRASDSVDDDLCVDPLEFDLIVEEIALLTSRPLQNSEQNPLFGKVATLADLVSFFSHQKRVA